MTNQTSLYTRHGVLTEQTLFRLVQNEWESTETHFPHTVNVGDLCQFGLTQNLTHLWVEPDALAVPPEKEFAQYDPILWDSVKLYWNGDQLKTVSARKPETTRGRRQITTVFAHNSRWAESREPGVPGWAQVATPKQLLITVAYLEKVLGVPISGSPGNAGWKLVQKLHPEWVFDIPNVDLRACHFGPESGREIIWQSPLLKQDMRGKYVHKFDRTMAYTAASSSSDAMYGVGTPLHVEGDSFDPKKVGVWRCTLRGGETSELLPPPWKGGEWIVGPTIRLLQYLGHEVRIHEGWVFPEQHQLMALWGATLWKARQSFEDENAWKHPVCRDFARQSIKIIANATIGTTAYSKFAEEETDQRRPDIRAQTVARSAELVYHNILKIYKTYGMTPAMVYMDAVYYIFDSVDGRATLPSMVAREGKLGGYKYEGHISIDETVNDIFAASSNTGRKLELLNTIGWKAA